MNYMPEMLKMIGVEVDEKFKIKGFSFNPYHFSELYNLLNVNGTSIESSYIIDIIKGTYEIEKLPWKPNLDDQYFFINEIGNIEIDDWLNGDYDYYRYNAKNCFRTGKEITFEAKGLILSEMKDNYEKF